MASIAAMQRQRRRASENHTERVVFRLTPGELARLDALRGARTRSSFIRDAIAHEAARRGHGVAKGGVAMSRKGTSGVPAGYDPEQLRG